MKKVAIVGDFNFPRGGASSNYVQYFGLALISAGFDVHVLSPSINRASVELNSDVQKNINVHEVILPTNKLEHYYAFNFSLGRYYCEVLEKLGFVETDIVFIYTRNYFHTRSIYKWCKKSNVRCGANVVEMFGVEDFANGFFDWRYWSQKFTYSLIKRKYDYIIPISSYLETYFGEDKDRVLRIPILADTKEFEKVEKVFEGKYKVVYPANGRIKDSLSVMLKALSDLPESSLDKLEFHLTGVRKVEIKELIDGQPCLNVIVHEWLEYSELIELYGRVHFLLLARDDRTMTRANFPSKVPEVMTHGVVPIVTIIGDYTKYYLKDSFNSICFEGDSVRACSNAIERALCTSEELYLELSSNARETVELELHYEKWAEKLKKFLR